jgi:signal transduction histidine kinase
MAPYPNIEVSVNGKEFVSLNQKGIGFTELTENDLPVKSIRIKNEQLEAASWNYGKGTLEIAIRKKNYQVASVIVKDERNDPLTNVRITFNGKTAVTVTSDAQGRINIPLAIGEVIYSASQFSAQGYAMIKFISTNGVHQLTVSRLQPKKVEEPVVTKATTKATPREVPTRVTLPPLDTIQSLTSFFSVFKNYDFKKLSRPEQQRVDARLAGLISQLTAQEEAIPSAIRTNYIQSISDSTFFGSDLKKIVKQANFENKIQEEQLASFDKKLRVINVKLANGIVRLDERSRQDVLHELASFENLLIKRENRFLKSQHDYRLLINNVKNRFFESENLPEKLTASEMQQQKQEDSYEQFLMAIGGIVILFALLIVSIIAFSYALRKQKKTVELANSEIKRTNETVESLVFKRTRALQLENKELDTFLYRASHDLRTPVRSILGLCNLADKLKGGEREEILDRIIDTSAGMDQLLKKLSIITEINQPSSFTAVTLIKIIDKVKHSFQRMIQENRIEFVVHCNEFLVFHTYPHLTEAILYNVIENALYFSTLKKNSLPRVELTAEIKDMAVMIKIRDNGIGIQENVKEKLFDMFFKGSEQSKGNGLGLYIVQKAVKVLDGKVMIESVAGQYTEFSIVLPLKTKADVKKEHLLHAELAE